MKTLLSAYLAKREIVRITDEKFPTFKRLEFSISASDRELTLIDSEGKEQNFDLSSVLEEGLDWIDACIDINEHYTVHADCRLGQHQSIPSGPKQIIFQPFSLPESRNNYNSTFGKGLFARGFIAPGNVSPLDVSLMCICDHCKKSFRLKKEHTGWGADMYFYCETGVHTLLRWPEKSFIWNQPVTWQKTEEQFHPCQYCGTSFRYMNPFRCPHCHEPYINFDGNLEARNNEYYAVSLYENDFQRWRP